MTRKDIRRATSRAVKDLHAGSLALKAVMTDLTLENLNLLENDDLEGEREAATAAFVAYCSHRRCHESLGNLTPTDLSFGRGTAILAEREKIKPQTIRNRSLIHPHQAA